jgi:glycogen operon protein
VNGQVAALPGADWFALEGSPAPLGATLASNGQAYNFALYSDAATAVTVHLYSATDFVHPVFSLPFDTSRNKSGPVWHARVSIASAKGAAYYAYEVDGASTPGTGGRFDPDKVLLDPYACAVFFPPAFQRDAASQPGSNAGRAPLGLLPRAVAPFDWGADAKPRHTSDAVVYEMHVKGFTNNPNSGVTPEKLGTFLGAIEKIPHLVDLGVTVVELMPIFLFDPEPGGDYWGYMPLCSFAPHRGYSNAVDPWQTIGEVKQLVKALHAAGIEVILDVVFNHTTEQGAGGPTYSYRGIDNATYYLLSPDGLTYIDFTGCGNSLATGEPAVRRLVVDSLRYWVSECHVDGFRFDLAGIFSRADDGSIDTSQPPIISEIISDPLLQDSRLIAEPYDLTSFELGRSFPGHTFLQWNGDFRDTIRKFVRGDDGTISDLMTRLYGSELDLFPADAEDASHAYQSVNFVDCHDGFCLYDVVSYDTKHNEANGPGHEGGTDDNLSNNCGVEGDAGVTPDILALRRLRVKGFFALLLVANGTPMFVMGDEFLRTQGGNNNPYNQDNETSWVDWNFLTRNSDIYGFVKGMIAFRKAHPSLGRSRFWGSDVTWYGVQGNPDQSFTSHTLAFCLADPGGFGSKGGPSTGPGPSIYVMANFYTQDLAFDLQQGPPGSWRRAIDTSLASPQDVSDPGNEPAVPGASYLVKAQSVVVLVSA